MRIIPLLTMLMFAIASGSATLVSEAGDVETITVPATVPGVTQVLVFTDTSCPYCAALHHRRNDLLGKGIAIQYLFYPRSGPDSESFRQAVAVWCSKDRLAALELALGGVSLPEAHCDNPIAEHYELARELGLLGTPAVITRDGTVRYGVVPAEAILDSGIQRDPGE